MKYQISHRTFYDYASDVSLSEQILHLEPRNTERQSVRDPAIIIEPEPAYIERYRDAFGNRSMIITIEQAHQRLSIEGKSEIDVQAPPAYSPDATPPWEDAASYRHAMPTGLAATAVPFAFPSLHTPADDAIEAYARQSFTPGRPILAAALDLNHRIFTDFKYDPAATTVTTHVTDLLTLKRGVCQDFSHLMLACLRVLGVPARYVSGYLLTHPPAGQEKLIGADASHAWVSLFVPGTGWVDLDPTNDLIPQDEHITLAYGLDYADVAPIAGVVYGGGRQQLSVAVDVTAQD